MKHTVSVIIPTFNRKNYIIKAIESVLSQTYRNYEIIVVDDGSTDDTKNILDRYITTGKIKYIYQRNAGASSARNMGLKIAKGEWISCLDSDDSWLPDKLENQVKIIRSSSTELGCLICNVRYNQSVGNCSLSFQDACFRPIHSQGICFNINEVLLSRFLLFNQCAMIKRKYLIEAGGFNEKLTILEDYDLALRLSFLCNWGYDTNPSVIYRIDSKNSLSSKIGFDHENQTLQYIYRGLKTFLTNKGLPIPNLLHKQIRFYSTLEKLNHNYFARFLYRIYRFTTRRLPGYPKPKTEKIELKQEPARAKQEHIGISSFSTWLN